MTKIPLISFIPLVTNLVTVADCYLPLQTNPLFTSGVFAHVEANLISYTVVGTRRIVKRRDSRFKAAPKLTNTKLYFMLN